MRHTYIVAYDISDPRRWRRVHRTMRGFGQHVQLSVFQCDLGPTERIRMIAALEEAIHHEEDQIILFDLGPSESRPVKSIEVLGRPMSTRERGAIIV